MRKIFLFLLIAALLPAPEARAEVRLPVVMYHHISQDPARACDYVVTPEQLEGDLRWLSERGCTAVSAREVIDYCAGRGELPEKPDIVLLDPPAFVKNRKALAQAVSLYVKLNKMALEGLESGGMLATSTCSHHISREIFVDILKQASAKAGKRVTMIELRGQAKDHPVLLGMPETEYLHFALLQVR